MLNFNKCQFCSGGTNSYLNTSHVKLQRRRRHNGYALLRYLNTSHVKLQRYWWIGDLNTQVHLNTSHVKLQRYIIQKIKEDTQI